MSRAKNEPIGEVECPQKGCSSKAPVFRFQARGAGSARFAGKLYSVCAVHGRYGGDGKQAAQEYILENATIWTTAPAPAATGPTPAAAPSTAPAAAPVKAAPAHWSDRWPTLIKL